MNYFAGATQYWQWSLAIKSLKLIEVYKVVSTKLNQVAKGLRLYSGNKLEDFCCY